jgi:hypothetical protein
MSEQLVVRATAHPGAQGVLYLPLALVFRVRSTSRARPCLAEPVRRKRLAPELVSVR